MSLKVTVWRMLGGFAGREILIEEGNNRLAPSSTGLAENFRLGMPHSGFLFVASCFSFVLLCFDHSGR